jgi:hypothetical protein
MEFGGEARSFDSTEAHHVRNLMDLISTYAVESTVWWDHPDGPESDGQPAPAPKKEDGTKTKGTDGQEEKPKAAPKAAPATVRGPVAATPSPATEEVVSAPRGQHQ